MLFDGRSTWSPDNITDKENIHRFKGKKQNATPLRYSYEGQEGKK